MYHPLTTTLATVFALMFALAVSAAPVAISKGGPAGGIGGTGAKTTVTEYVIGFKKGVPPPFNKVVLATFPPGTSWAIINAFVLKAEMSGLYDRVIVTTALPPG